MLNHVGTYARILFRKKFFSSIELGQNGYQYNKHALVKLPIIKKVISLPDDEQEINRKLNELYGLSDEEIDFIENMSNNH